MRENPLRGVTQLPLWYVRIWRRTSVRHGNQRVKDASQPDAVRTIYRRESLLTKPANMFYLTGNGRLCAYALIPMLTKLDIRSQRLVNLHFWTWIVGSVAMVYAMGMASVQGMLRRTLYPLPNTYQPHLAIALAGALLMAVGFLVFLVNIISTLGRANILSLIVPERWLAPRTGQAAV